MIRHDLSRPRLIVSSKVLQVVFVHLIHILILFFILLFIFVACRSQLDLYLLIFPSTGSSFNSSSNSSFLLWSKMVYPTVLLKNFISIWYSSFLSFFIWVQISLPRKIIGTANALYIFIVENFSTKVGLKALFRTTSTSENFASFS